MGSMWSNKMKTALVKKMFVYKFCQSELRFLPFPKGSH